jgi:ribosomal protein S19
MTIGSKNVKVNGVPCTTDVAPYIKNGRTFVPVRFISESIGAKVEYFSVTKEILITK